MIPLRLTRDDVRERDPGALAGELAGLVTVLDVRSGDGSRLATKGSVLDRETARALLEEPWEELHLLRLEEGDVHEADAGRRLAAAVAGSGVEAGDFAGGHWPLRAVVRGILEVDVERLRRVNAVEELAVYTRHHGRVGDAGDPVARVKVIPFAVPEERLRRAESEARKGEGIVRIRPFRSTRVAAVVLESLGDGGLARFRETLGEKVRWLGSELAEPRLVEPATAPVTAALDAAIDDGAGVVVVAGTKAMDPLDPTFDALDGVGAEILRHGVPAHPGSLLWLARAGDVPIIGVPTCGLFSRATVFDLVLPRVLAGLSVDADHLASLGHGGFLTRELSWRFPPYRSDRERGELDA